MIHKYFVIIEELNNIQIDNCNKYLSMINDFCKDKKILYYNNENTRQQRLSVSLQKKLQADSERRQPVVCRWLQLAT